MANELAIPTVLAAQTAATADHLKAEIDQFELVQRWAPYVFQDTDEEEEGQIYQDWITNLYYNGQDITNNWEGLEPENLDPNDLAAYVYYSVVETETHYYLGYFFYHPRDWEHFKKADDNNRDPRSFEHEHDLEGIMLVVSKPAVSFSDLEFMYTQGHGDTYYFLPDNTYSLMDVVEYFPCFASEDHLDHLIGNPYCPEAENTTLYDLHDGRVGHDRVAVFIETPGHGIGQIRRAMDPNGNMWDFDGTTYSFYGGDGILYYPSLTNTAGVPVGLNDEVEYKLVPMWDFWLPRHAPSTVYQDPIDLVTQRGVSITDLGSKIRSAGSPGAGANPPWVWDENSDCGSPGVCADDDDNIRGDWFLDPATFVKSHLSNTESFSQRYLYNPYLLNGNGIALDEVVDTEVGDDLYIYWSLYETSFGTGLASQCSVFVIAATGERNHLGTANASDCYFVWSDVHRPVGSPPYRIWVTVDSAAPEVGADLQATDLSNAFYISDPMPPPCADLIVSNVEVVQRPFSNLYDVTYDLDTVGCMPVTVSLILSADGGATFGDTCSAVTGDVGSGVVPGTSRHIIWDAKADFHWLVSETCRLRVYADDHESDPNPPPGFVYIPPGTFTMGSPDDEPGRHEREGPQHQVTLTKGFYMSMYEVTQELWTQVMGGTAYDPQFPMAVSWDMAVQFCNELSVLEGLTPAYTIHGPNGNVTWHQDANGYRLPTEAEWEYACRATTSMAYHNDSNCLDSTTEANFRGNVSQLPGCPLGIHLGESTEVGSFPANQWGLFDMHGNLWEWVWCGWYRMYTEDAVVDPVYDVEPGDNRVIRGGDWHNYPQFCRSANRAQVNPAYQYSNGGFRPVRTAF